MRFSILLIISLFAFNTFAQGNQIPQENELVPYKVKEKWGAASVDGKLKISGKYDELKPFFHNVTKVVKNDKQGVIDTRQKVIVPIMYDEVEQMIYSKNGDISFICNKDDKAMLQIGKKVIVPLSEGYEKIYAFVDSNHIESYYILSKKKGTVFQFDLINSKGDKIIENAVGDVLRIISINTDIKHDYDIYANIYADMSNSSSTSKKKTASYWWSEAEVEFDYETDMRSALEDLDYGGYDSYNRRDNFDLDDYNRIDDFKSAFIKLAKKQSRNSVARAFYTMDGSEVFNFKDKVEKVSAMTDDLLIVKTYDDDLNCKKPTKYGIYNLKTGAYKYKPVYGFFSREIIKKDMFTNRFEDEVKAMELMCENLDEIKKMYEETKSRKLVGAKIMGLLGVKMEKPEYVIALASENDIKILNEEGSILTEATISDGEFIPDDFFQIHTKDSIYVGIEVFNDTYRGKGIKHVNSGDIVVMPIYEEISRGYGGYITLSGSDMATLSIEKFNFPLNKNTANIGDDFVRALSNSLYVVSKNKEEVAIYCVSLEKNITKYKYSTEFDYPKIKVINKREYVFLLDTDGNYSVIDEDGKVLVPSSEEEIEVKDIYGNNKVYFITVEGYYGLDGKKYFK